MTFCSSTSLATKLLLSGVCILLLFCTHFSIASDLPENHLCKRLSRPDYKSTLTGALQLGEQLLLIDSVDDEYLVYDVPASAFSTPDQVDISAVLPKKIEEYWPSFNAIDGEWKKNVKKNYKMFYPVSSWVYGEEFHYVNIDSAPKDDDKNLNYGLVYNLDTQKMTSGRACLDAVEQTITLAAIPQICIFSLSSESFGSVNLPRVRTWLNEYCEASNLKNWHISGKVAYGMNRTCQRGELDQRHAAESGHFFYMVNKNNQDVVEMITVIKNKMDGRIETADYFTRETNKQWEQYKDYLLRNVTDWNLDSNQVPIGYLSSGFFYLFTPDKVLVFKNNMARFFQQVNLDRYEEHRGEVQPSDYDILPGDVVCAPSNLKMLAHCQFFKCPADDAKDCHPGSTDTNRPITSAGIIIRLPGTSTFGGALLFIVILIFFLIVLLVIALVVYFFCLGEGGGEAKQEKGTKKNSMKTAGSRKKKQQKQSVSSFNSNAYSKDGGGGSRASTSKVPTSAAPQSMAPQSNAPQSKAGNNQPPNKASVASSSGVSALTKKNSNPAAATTYATSFNETSVNKVF